MKTFIDRSYAVKVKCLLAEFVSYFDNFNELILSISHSMRSIIFQLQLCDMCFTGSSLPALFYNRPIGSHSSNCSHMAVHFLAGSDWNHNSFTLSALSRVFWSSFRAFQVRSKCFDLSSNLFLANELIFNFLCFLLTTSHPSIRFTPYFFHLSALTKKNEF